MKIKPGRVWIEGKGSGFKPFLKFREIRRGKNKGMIEVELQPMRPRKVLFEKSAIKAFPVWEEE